MKKQLILSVFVFLGTLTAFAQRENGDFSAYSYLVDETRFVGIADGIAGTEMAYHTEQFGGKRVGISEVNDKGASLFMVPKTDKVALIVNLKTPAEGHLAGKGKVAFLTGDEFELAHLSVAENGGKATISWDGAKRMADDLQFILLSSTDRVIFSPIYSTWAVGGALQHYSVKEQQGAGNVWYKLQVSNVMKGVRYVSAPLQSDGTRYFKVFPTLCDNTIIISGDENLKNTFYKMVDNLGKTVKHGSLIEGNTTVDVSSLASGMYVVILKDGLKSSYQKIMKQ